ncbi:MAG TPA: GH25 family lysozyme, partial [Anseongella sp.]|nr:GH25 family lysozyme [Anseongella sp.]
MAKRRPTKRQRNFRRSKWLSAIICVVVLTAFFYAPLARNFSGLASWTSDLLDDYHYKHIESFGIRMPTRYKVHGIDVSRYQGRIDWEKVAGMESEDIRISFAYIKATEGMLLVDQYFKRNWKESREQGILRGAYHYFKPHV